MKTTSKVLALVLAFVCCATCFVACGSGNEFVIGGTGPLAGQANSEYGVAVQQGATIAVEEINANGGFNGVQFKLDMKPDDCSATNAETAYAALVGSMKVSLCSVTSGAAKAFAAAAKEDNVFCLTPSGSADDVIAQGDHAFRVCFGDPQQGVIAANKLVNDDHRAKIGVVYDTSDTYSSGLYEAFEGQMTVLNKTKGTDYVVTTFNSDTKEDFSAQVQTMKEAGCDAIFLPIYYGEANKIARAAHTVSFDIPILGCDGLDGIAGQLAGSGVTAKIQYITPFDVTSTDPVVANFVAKYKERYGSEPNQFAADGYDAVMIIYNAMKFGNVDTNASASDICNALKGILTGVTKVDGGAFSYTGVTGSDMTWETSGSCNKAAKIVDVKF